MKKAPAHRGKGFQKPASRAHSRLKARAGRLASGEVIMESATALFLKNGYLSTSMDDIAARAGISKRTIYTHFQDKAQLFREMVISAAKTSDRAIDAFPDIVKKNGDPKKILKRLAHQLVATVFRDQVIQMRRLSIMESARFPQIAREYFRLAPQRARQALASVLQSLSEKGMLRIDNPTLAADHFSALVLMIPLDSAMFGERFPLPELERRADEGIRVFLSAYARA